MGLILLLGCSPAPQKPAAVHPTLEPTASPSPAATLPPSPTSVSRPQQYTASTGPAVRLPEDEAPHQTPIEWWYYTGHLTEVQREGGPSSKYGFEMVFFQVYSKDNFPVYVGHMAITDREKGAFVYDQRFSFLPQASSKDGFELKIGDWAMRSRDGLDSLAARMKDYALDLTLRAVKPAVLHGGVGLVPMSGQDKSYYYSRTRMEASGTIQKQDGLPAAVTGLAWMDHQWGDFNPDGGGGWDWLGLQLEDGTELMISVIRGTGDGILLAYGTYVDGRGDARHLPAESFRVEATGQWTSPHSGATYPSGWKLSVPDLRLDLVLTPTIADQELNTVPTTGVIYWEGEVDITGKRDGRGIIGAGYAELTGYADTKSFLSGGSSR